MEELQPEVQGLAACMISDCACSNNMKGALDWKVELGEQRLGERPSVKSVFAIDIDAHPINSTLWIYHSKINNTSADHGAEQNKWQIHDRWISAWIDDLSCSKHKAPESSNQNFKDATLGDDRCLCVCKSGVLFPELHEFYTYRIVATELIE